uniref:PPM-type phosphatase domain-containing protein n=1 Tax=Arcella intermedia TaxID=1963864 RepID=A0A6B2L4G0_9EUKA
MEGPNDQDNQTKALDRVAARSISLFPLSAVTNNEIGGPNTDRYKLFMFRNRVVFTLADGFGRGLKGARAAEIATRTVINHLKEQNTIVDQKQAGKEILNVIATAHEALLQAEKYSYPEKDGTFDNPATVSLMAGIIMEIQHPNPPAANPSKSPTKKRKTWSLMVASVGSCKAFHYSSRKKVVTQMAYGHPQRFFSNLDPGGRIGPFINNSCPDLRNFFLYMCPCLEEDFIFVVSNGVADNLDPEILGLCPEDLAEISQTPSFSQRISKMLDTKKPQQQPQPQLPPGASPTASPSNNSATTKEPTPDPAPSAAPTKLNLPEDWEDLNPVIRNALKSEYAVQTLNQIINHISNLTPSTLVDSLLDYSSNVTKERRNFLKKYPHRKPPKQSKAYPGHLDHATAICFEIKRPKVPAPSPAQI